LSLRIVVGYLGTNPISLDLSRSNKNTLVVGSSQTGKTILVTNILLNMIEAGYDGNVLVLDPTGQYGFLEKYEFKRLVPGEDFFINPLDLPEPYPFEILTSFPEYTFGNRGLMSPIQQGFLRRALENSRNLLEVYTNLEDFRDRAVSEGDRNALDAVLNRLYPVFRIKAFARTDGEIPRGFNIIDLSLIPGDDAKTLFSITLFYILYQASYIGALDNTLLFIEEADRIGHEPIGRKHIIGKIMDEMSKYGLWCVFISHTIAGLCKEIRNSCDVKFVFRLNDPEDIALASKMVFVPPREIAKLPKGLCFYKQGEKQTFRILVKPRPFIVKEVEFFKARKPKEELLLKLPTRREVKSPEEKLREEVEEASRKALTELDRYVSGKERRLIASALSDVDLILKLLKVRNGERISYSTELKDYVKYIRLEKRYKLTKVGAKVLEIFDKYR